MNRSPPQNTKRILRQEVRFGCPISFCRSPYLTWHHFAPPWNERKHHDPAGMIALCREHHDKADNGAYTIEQLHRFKTIARDYNEDISSRFEWMRRDIVAVMGSSYFFNPRYIFSISGRNCFWYNRDDEGYILVNIKPPGDHYEGEFVMEDNFWSISPNLSDVECPPSGKLLKLTFARGDKLEVSFFELGSAGDAKGKYPNSDYDWWSSLDKYPVTVCEVHMNMPTMQLKISPQGILTPNNNYFHNIYSKNSIIGLDI